LVESVSEGKHGVVVTARDIHSKEIKTFHAKAVLVAAGAINTTRLLLRSLKRYDALAPIMLKNNWIIPCLFPSRLGKVNGARRHSLAQLAINGVKEWHGMSDLYAQVLSYNSLLLYKLLPYVPLSAPESFNVISMLAPSFVLIDVRFPSVENGSKGVCLRKEGSRDYLDVVYPEDPNAIRAQKEKIRSLKKMLRHMGLLPLSTVRNPYGATSHYVGGAPVEGAGDYPLAVTKEGQLKGHERIFVADASSWRALPAKPSGLTMMANANRIGRKAALFIG
jgi:hypothetical protein